MTASIVRIAEATGFDRSKIELVKDTVAKGASDDELMLFLSLAHRSGLDPFSRQIYLIERRQNVDGQWRTSRQPQTGIDGLRLIADRSGNYAPGRAPTYEYSTDGQLFSATAYVMKFVRGQWHEVAATAHYTEYVQTKKDNNPTQMWADKPHIMLAKCAEALALRRAFPADMSGLYTSDEVRDETPVALLPLRTALPPAPPVAQITGEVIESGATYNPADAFAGELSGMVENVEPAFTKGGELSLRFTLRGYTCLYHKAPAELVTLADGDNVIAKGDLRTYKGQVVVSISGLEEFDATGTWAARYAEQQEAEPESAPV